jgi:hypothetical protein
MKCGTCTILALLSLLLSFGIMFAWVRSDTHRDAWRFVWSGRDYAFASQQGTVGIDNKSQIADFEEKKFDDLQEVDAEDRAIPTDGSPKSTEALLAINNRLTAINNRHAPLGVRISVHFWILAAISAILPAMWCVRFHRRRLREAMGQCVVCGYDLRATPSQCPECGTVSKLNQVLPKYPPIPD